MTRGFAGLQSLSTRAPVSRGTTVVVGPLDGGPVGQPLRLAEGTWRVYAALLGADGGPAHWAGQNAWSVSLRLSVGIGAATYVETHPMRPSGTVITRAADYLQVQTVVSSALGFPARIVLAGAQPIAGAAPTWVTSTTLTDAANPGQVAVPAGATSVEAAASGLSALEWFGGGALIARISSTALLPGPHRVPDLADQLSLLTSAPNPVGGVAMWGFPA